MTIHKDSIMELIWIWTLLRHLFHSWKCSHEDWKTLNFRILDSALSFTETPTLPHFVGSRFAWFPTLPHFTEISCILKKNFTTTTRCFIHSWFLLCEVCWKTMKHKQCSDWMGDEPISMHNRKLAPSFGCKPATSIDQVTISCQHGCPFLNMNFWIMCNFLQFKEINLKLQMLASVPASLHNVLRLNDLRLCLLQYHLHGLLYHPFHCAVWVI